MKPIIVKVKHGYPGAGDRIRVTGWDAENVWGTWVIGGGYTIHRKTEVVKVRSTR